MRLGSLWEGACDGGGYGDVQHSMHADCKHSLAESLTAESLSLMI